MTDELVYRTVRFRPFRKNPMLEAGYDSQGIPSVELAELWIGGDLEAVVRPAANEVLFHPGGVPENVLKDLTKQYVRTLENWTKRSPV